MEYTSRIRLQLSKKISCRTSRSITMKSLRTVSTLLFLLSHDAVVVTGFMYNPKRITSFLEKMESRDSVAAILPYTSYSPIFARTRAATTKASILYVSGMGWDNDNFLESLGKGPDAINDANEQYRQLSRFGRRPNSSKEDDDDEMDDRDVPGLSKLSREHIERIKNQNEQIESTGGADGGEMYKKLLERAEQQKRVQAQRPVAQPPPSASQGLPDNFASLTVEQQAALFRELMLNQNNPMQSAPLTEESMERRTTPSKDDKRFGRNRDADAIVNSSDVYLTQLKLDSTSRLRARYSGDDEKANQVFHDPRIQGIKMHVNPYLEEQRKAERELYGFGDLLELVPDAEYDKDQSFKQQSYAGIKYKDRLLEKRLRKGSSPPSSQMEPPTSISKAKTSIIAPSGSEAITTNDPSAIGTSSSTAPTKPLEANPLREPFTKGIDDISNDPLQQVSNTNVNNVIPKQPQPVSHYDQWSYKPFSTPNSNTKTDYRPSVVGNIPEPPKPKSHYDQWQEKTFEIPDEVSLISDIKASNTKKAVETSKTTKSHYDQWSDRKLDQSVTSDLKANTAVSKNTEKSLSHYDQWSSRKLHIPEQMSIDGPDVSQSSMASKPVSHWDQWANKPFQTPVDETMYRTNVVKNIDPLGPRAIGVDEGIMPIFTGSGRSVASEPPVQARDSWRQQSFEAPPLEVEYRSTRPPLQTSSASSSISSSYTLPAGDDEIRNGLRTLMGLLLKHKGGSGFGLGRLQGKEIERFMDVADSVLDALSHEAEILPSILPEQERYQEGYRQPSSYKEPYQSAIAMQNPSVSISEQLDKMIACVEGAIQMYKFSPPEFQDGVLMTLRAALLSAVKTCNDVIPNSATMPSPSPSSSSIPTGDRLKNMIGVLEGAIQMYKFSPSELQKNIILTIRTMLLSTINLCNEMMAGGSYDVVSEKAASTVAEVVQPPAESLPPPLTVVNPYQQPIVPPSYSESARSDSAATPTETGTSSTAPPPRLPNDSNSKFFQGVYNRLKVAAGNGKLGLKDDIALNEAEELVDDINEMRKLLVQEVESGIPIADTSSEFNQLSSSASKYNEMLAKARANKRNGVE